MNLTWRLRATAAILLIPPLLELLSFAQVERLVREVARFRVRSAPEDAAAAQWVDAKLARLRGPWAFTCLRRAAVLYFLLRSRGVAVELWIGVRRGGEGALHAHAWLTRNSEPYLEAPEREPASDFNVIARFPDTVPSRG